MKALVSPVKLDPSVVLTTVTACVDGGAAPCATATFGFHPAIVPSMVEKRNTAGAPGASRKSVLLPLAMVPVGAPVGVFLSFGSAGGMVTIKDCLAPAPLYTVLNPVPSYEPDDGLPEARDKPHGFISCGSGTGATPAALE